MSVVSGELAHQVNAHLLRSLSELASCPAQEWPERLAGLRDSLRSHGHPDELLPVVLRASAVIQQFLLELATRPSRGYPVEQVLQKADWVLTGR